MTALPQRMPSTEWANKDTSMFADRSRSASPFRVPTPSQMQRTTSQQQQRIPTPTLQQQQARSPTPTPQIREMQQHGSIDKSAQPGLVGSMKPYLPESVAAYLPREKEHSVYPSKETPGGSMVGVGSLPGNYSEASVAKLPEERQMEARERELEQHKPHKKEHHKKQHHKEHPSVKAATAGAAAATAATSPTGGTAHAVGPSPLPSKEIPSGSRGGVGSLPGNYSEVSVAKTPEERRLESLPSHDTNQEILGKTGGVGPLPGGPDESRVALLPEERSHPQYDTGIIGSAPIRATGMAGIAGLGAAGAASMQKSSPLKEDSQGSGTGMGGTMSASTGSAHMAQPDVRLDPGYHPAALHPLDPKFQKTEPDVQASQQHAMGTSSGSASASEEGVAKGGERHSVGHKIGLMEKMRGEAKVISGKLSHDGKNVEMGRHMMGKD
ncbi:hypothetical protein H0H92_002829 [Tricholoma furcatifolium]|nr:hypothetical protein H0H92_002829 [Tricholoma furcatifolium]